jgi:hypothetical protein
MPGVPDGWPAGRAAPSGNSWKRAGPLARRGWPDAPVALDCPVTCELCALVAYILLVPYLAASFPVRPGPDRSTGVKIRTGARDHGGFTMLLPDFSENQSSGAPNWIPTPDFAGVKRKNGGAAIIRVSYGIDHRDHCFIRNRRAAQHHKYAFLGLYQYVLPGDITAQARAFCRWVGELAPNEIPIADIEEFGQGDQNRRAEKWFDIVDRKLGLSAQPIKRRSWLYSGESNLTTRFARVCASGRSIWVAAYRATEPTLDHILWQSTGGEQTKSGEAIGIHQVAWPDCGRNCDTSLYHGTLKKLAAATSRDDLPYPKKEILKIVRKGVAAELRADLDGTGVTLAQGAEAAVRAQQALEQLRQQVEDLATDVEQHLPGPQRMEHAGTR